MSQFDLKQAHLFIRDGYSNEGTVNHPSGYDQGATVLAVDGLSGAVANGDILIITGDTTNYTIVSHTETLGATTSITVSPALAQSVADNAVITYYEPNVDTGAVNNGAGYAAASTTMLMDGFTGALANGDKFKITGQTTIYTISAHTETLGNTTSITFAPGLSALVVDDDVLTFYEPNVDTGAINNSTAGYGPGVTTIHLSGITGSLEGGAVFYLAGDPDSQKYTISSAVDVLGNTVQVTFSPATGEAFTLANGAVVTVGPHELDVKLGDGNLTYSEKRAIEYKLDRGVIDEVRAGDQAPVEIKMDAIWEWIKASTGEIPTIEDCLKKRGVAANWVSSDSDSCRPYAVDLVLEYHPQCDDGTEMETIYLSDFRYEQIDHDAKAGTFAITGKCNITEATSVRSAA